MATRFSRVLPYPAMVADGLAEALASAFVEPGDRVLDPFCGTGRLLVAAAERGAYCVGVDVNPLAVLVTKAKAGRCSARVLLEFLELTLAPAAREKTESPAPFGTNRKVAWFSRKVAAELWDIVHLINEAKLPTPELWLVAAVLAATVREVSFCRDDQWKLHRLPAPLRHRWPRSAWTIFRRRLGVTLHELRTLSIPRGKVRVFTGDARHLSSELQAHRIAPPFDVVMTSPPYGDSRTTVHYGGTSSLCLGVLCHVNGVGLGDMPAAAIDRHCLGGGAISASALAKSNLAASRLRHYWQGGQDNPVLSGVRRFLTDLERSCLEIARVLKPRGRLIVVAGRRRTGGWRLYLDRVIIEVCHEANLRLDAMSTRRIIGKRTPSRVDALGRHPAKAHVISTMREEQILVFSKKNRA